MKPRRRGSVHHRPEPLGQLLTSVLHNRGYLNVCKETQIITRWENIAGEQIASRAIPDRIEKGNLFLRVSSAVWRQELSFMKEHLLQRIRQETDCSTVTDIVFL